MLVSAFLVYALTLSWHTTYVDRHAVFNEGGVNADFRVETDAQANAFVIDAGDDTATFTNCPVEITHSGNGYQLRLTSTDADASVGPNLRMYRNFWFTSR
jgi:hypothetical protein